MELCCSTAWPSFYREEVFMQSPGKIVSHMYKSSLHTWRAYWDKKSQFIFKIFLGVMYSTGLLKCACITDANSTRLLYLKDLTPPPPFLRFVNFHSLWSHSQPPSIGDHVINVTTLSPGHGCWNSSVTNQWRGR